MSCSHLATYLVSAFKCQALLLRLPSVGFIPHRIAFSVLPHGAGCLQCVNMALFFGGDFVRVPLKTELKTERGVDAVCGVQPNLSAGERKHRERAGKQA